MEKKFTMRVSEPGRGVRQMSGGRGVRQMSDGRGFPQMSGGARGIVERPGQVPTRQRGARSGGILPAENSTDDVAIAALRAYERLGFFRDTLVFNKRLSSYTYSSPLLNEILGEPDLFKLMVYVDGRSAVASTQVTLIAYHSPDGITWAPHPYWLDAVPFTGNTLYQLDSSAFALSSQLRRLSVGIVGDPGAQARVRIWVTSRGRAKRRIHEALLDQFIVGTAPTIGSDEGLAELLGGSDALQLFAIADDVSSAGGTPTLTVQIEESPDGQNWRNKTGVLGTPEINVVPISLMATTAVVGQDSGAQPTSNFLRLRVQLGGSSPAAHIRIFATGRGA